MSGRKSTTDKLRDFHGCNGEEFPEEQRGDAWEPKPEKQGQQEEPEPWDQPIPLRTASQVPKFPLHVLPDRLAWFVEDVAAAVNCPPDYPAATMLAIAGAAIGATWSLRVKEDYFERPCVFVAVVGPPGAAKSPAIAAVAKPLYQEQARRARAHRLEMKEWSSSNSETRGERPERSALSIKNATVEAAAECIYQNPRGLVQVLDELASLVAGMNQYKPKGAGTDRHFYLSVWAGEPIDIIRKKDGGNVYVAHPFLNVVGALTPDLLGKLRGEEGVLDGFFDRFLPVFPDSVPEKKEDWKTIDRDNMDAWAGTLHQLWSLEQDPGNGEDPPHPNVLRLGPDGMAAWVRFTESLATEVNDNAFPDFLRSPWRKLKGYCARLAVILHWLQMANLGNVAVEHSGGEVAGETIDAAAELISYFKVHARKAYAALNADPDARALSTLLNWVARRPASERFFRRWEVQRDLQNQGTFPRVEDIERHLHRLAKHGYVRAATVTRQGDTGRMPGPVYEINPLWDRRENRENREKAPDGPRKPA